MKLKLSILLTSLFFVTACNSPSSSDKIDIGIDGAKLANDYKSYEKINDDLVKSNQHGGIFVSTFINDIGIDSFRNESFPYKEGSMIVKEGHKTEDAEADTLYLMKKMKGFDSENGDWIYAVYDAKGEVKREPGKIQMCISCHQGAKEKDYIFGF